MNKIQLTANQPLFCLDLHDLRGRFVPIAPLVQVFKPKLNFDDLFNFNRYEKTGDVFNYTKNNAKELDTFVHELVHFDQVFGSTSGLLYLHLTELQTSISIIIASNIEKPNLSISANQSQWPGLISIANGNNLLSKYAKEWCQIERFTNAIFGNEQCKMIDVFAALFTVLDSSSFLLDSDPQDLAARVAQNSESISHKTASLGLDFIQDPNPLFRKHHPYFFCEDKVLLNTTVLFENYARFFEQMNLWYYTFHYGPIFSSKEFFDYFWKEKFSNLYFATQYMTLGALSEILDIPHVDRYKPPEENGMLQGFNKEESENLLPAIGALYVAHELALMTPLFPACCHLWPPSISWVDLHPVERFAKILRGWETHQFPLPDIKLLAREGSLGVQYLDEICTKLDWPHYSDTIKSVISLKAENPVLNMWLKIAKPLLTRRLRQPFPLIFDPIFRVFVEEDDFPIVLFQNNIQFVKENQEGTNKFLKIVTCYARSVFFRLAAAEVDSKEIVNIVDREGNIPGFKKMWDVLCQNFTAMPFG